MVRKYDVRDFVLLGYKAFGGKIHGKTMMQKRMYFLSVILEADLGYAPHYYGPYSAEVAVANADLKNLDFLAERSASWAFDHRGFEMARFDYQLTEAGQRIAEKKSKLLEDVWNEIENAAHVITEAGDLDYMELSIAAKTYFALTRLSGKATVDEVSKLLPKLGWSVRSEDLSRAALFLEKAHLITRD